MGLLYLCVLILLSMSGVDVVNDVRFPSFLGVVFSVFAGVMKIWRAVSR